MKITALLFFLATVAAGRADNLLTNGDFSDGIAHWYGNVQLTDGAGVAIKLRPHEWTRARQEFRVKPGTYKLHISLAFSPGLSFSKQYADYTDLLTKLDFQNKDHPMDGETGKWTVVIADSAAATTRSWDVESAQPEGGSYTFTLEGIDLNHSQTLIIGFPPGTGSVGLKSISLVPDKAP